MKIETTLTSVALFALAWTAAQGCSFERVDTTHCNYNDGDSYCAEKYPDGSYPFCESGFTGCISPQRTFGCTSQRPTDECYSPCGGSTTVEDDASCLSGEASSGSTGSDSGSSEGESSSGSETTDAMTTTGPEPCTGHDDCVDESAPLCDPAVGECVACDSISDGNGDAACAELDAMTPLCVDAQCVACTAKNTSVCDALLMLCDEATNACAPCTEHGQCESGACDLAVGSCFASDDVVHVDGDPGADPSDFSSVVDAVMSIEAGERGVIVVHELNGDSPYTQSVTINDGKTIALIGAEGEAPVVQGTGGNPGLSVEGNETVAYVEGVGLVGNTTAEGLSVDAAMVDLRRSRIVQNSGGGIVAQGGAMLTVENCFVGSLGGVVGIDIDSASVEVLYSTVTASTFGSTPAIGCSSPVAVDVRNSIVVTQGGTSPDELSCDGAVLTNTATEARLPPFDAGWFTDFNGGDYHLTAMAPIGLNAAVWTTGDPLTDIDGDLRPSTDGATDYAGADVP